MYIILSENKTMQINKKYKDIDENMRKTPRIGSKNLYWFSLFQVVLIFVLFLLLKRVC